MKTTWLTATMLVCAMAAQAQDVSLTLPDSAEDMRPKLEGASLSFALQEDNAPTSEDYVAGAQADYRRLLLALYNLGYYAGDISIRVNGVEAAQISPFQPPARIDTVRIRVLPGPQFKFARAEVTPLPDRADIPSRFARGEVAEADAIRDAAKAGVTAWRAHGHAKADVADSAISAHHPSKTLDARVTLAPGPRLRFGPLLVEGTSAVRPERIREIAGLRSGTVFSPEDLDTVAARLRRTGVFESVALSEAEHWREDGTLPITVRVSDTKPRRIGAGVEYSNTEGLALSAYWLHRNWLGGAERLRLDGAITGIGEDGSDPDYRLGAEFSRPATWDTENTLRIWARYTYEDTPAFSLRELDTGIGLHRIVNKEFELDAGIGVLTASARDALGTRRYTLLTLPLSASLDRRDDARNARKGYYLKASATPFYGIADAPSGIRLSGEARGYLSLGADDRVTLAGRAQIGSLIGPEIAAAPSEYLFFSGGGGSVRGQPFQSLGSGALGDMVIGGRSYGALSLEARVQVREKIGVVGFADLGAVGADPVLDGGNWHAGAGIGLRYDTPLGPLRVDLATPVTGENRFKRAQFYVGIGQSF